MLPLSPLRRPPRREGAFAVQLLLFQFRKQFDYVNYNGLEDFWTYHNQNIGRAGTAYYEYVDEDGTAHYFYKDENQKWVDETGIQLTLTIGSGTEDMHTTRRISSFLKQIPPVIH